MSHKSIARDCGRDGRPSPARDPAVAIDARRQARPLADEPAVNNPLL
jgi:hypothetical protein